MILPKCLQKRHNKYVLWESRYLCVRVTNYKLWSIVKHVITKRELEGKLL